MDKGVRRKEIGTGIFFIWVCAMAAFIVTANACFAEDAEEKPYYKGVEYAAAGKFEEARQEFMKAAGDEEFYAPAKLELHAVEDVINGKIKKETALLAFEGKRFAINSKTQEAIAKYSEAIKANPNYGYAFISRGIAYGDLGMIDEAMSNYSEALDVDPAYTEAYNNRGVLYQLKGRYNKAIDDFTKAIGADPKIVQLYYNRALAYSYRGQHDRAIPDFDKAIELKPDYAKAYMGKAVSCEKLKLSREAVEAYKKAIEANCSKDASLVEYANERIKVLEEYEAKKEKAREKK